jgi:hypothetical protein
MDQIKKKTNKRIGNFGLKGSAKKKNQFHKRNKKKETTKRLN